MIEIIPIRLENGIAIGITVQYPKTTLLSICTKVGYIMCGVLDIAMVDNLHRDRNIVAARMIHVKSFEDLLNATVLDATIQAQRIGIEPGKTTGREALELMLQLEKKVDSHPSFVIK